MVARDNHQWTLVAAALLEDKIERMSCSLSCSHQCSRNCRCLGSHRWKRSQTVDYQTKVPQAMSHDGDPAKRWAQSPSPSQLRQWVTFTHSSPKSSPERDTSVKEPYLPTWGDKGRPDDQSDWSRPGRWRPWVPPLECHIQEFLRGEEMLPAAIGVKDGLPWTSMPPGEQRVDKVVHMPTSHASLVVGTQGGPWPR